MSETAILAIIGCLFGLGLFLALTALRNIVLDRRDLPGNAKDETADPQIDVGRAVLAVVCGMFMLVVFGLPAVALGVTGAVYLLPLVFQRTGVRTFGERTDAIAVWIENVRNSLGATQGLHGAIRSGSLHPPESMADDLKLFVRDIDHGTEMSVALADLASRLEHPIADQAIGTLIMAVRSGATGVRDVLNDVADTSRQMARNMGEVHASRAKSMMSMRLVLGAIGLFSVLFVVATREYLAPYGSALGQMVLGVLLVLVGLNLYWIYSLSRYKQPNRPLRPERLLK